MLPCGWCSLKTTWFANEPLPFSQRQVQIAQGPEIEFLDHQGRTRAWSAWCHHVTLPSLACNHIQGNRSNPSLVGSLCSHNCCESMLFRLGSLLFIIRVQLLYGGTVSPQPHDGKGAKPTRAQLQLSGGTGSISEAGTTSLMDIASIYHAARRDLGVLLHAPWGIVSIFRPEHAYYIIFHKRAIDHGER